jgi:tRNA nucleotidyltransferase (CCA-adding enzyme)
MEKEKDLSLAIAKEVASAGGRAYLVGGIVRDRLINRENKDIDIEVHGIEPGRLTEILDRVAPLRSEGKKRGHFMKGASFGVYGIYGSDIDIAMPRTEAATGRGHKDFEVFVDPYLGTEKAAARRDFTINALMQDILTGEIVDHFGGQEDLKAGVLRHITPEGFAEDPLRVFRAAQFAARFKFEVAPETIELCGRMDVSALSKERVMGELEKALLRAEKPSVFFEVLRKMNRLEPWFSELEPLIGLEQSPIYHPEGDVWVHTMQVLDNAAAVLGECRAAGEGNVRRPASEKGFMLAALMHDLGKAVTTAEIDGRIRALQHETKGLPIAKELLSRLTEEKVLHKYVLNMIELHMRPNMLAGQKSGVKATNRLFDASVDPAGLILLSRCDRRRETDEGFDYSEYEGYLWERLEVYEEMMKKPFVGGEDLIKAGLIPDEDFSLILEYAHKLRLSGVPKKEALCMSLGYAEELAEKNEEN